MSIPTPDSHILREYKSFVCFSISTQELQRLRLGSALDAWMSARSSNLQIAPHIRTLHWSFFPSLTAIPSTSFSGYSKEVVNVVEGALSPLILLILSISIALSLFGQSFLVSEHTIWSFLPVCRFKLGGFEVKVQYVLSAVTYQGNRFFVPNSLHTRFCNVCLIWFPCLLEIEQERRGALYTLDHPHSSLKRGSNFSWASE